MNKNILFVLWIMFPIFSMGQSKLAKLKFEQAQELFGNKEYSLALQKLDETQQILGSTNPRILHLRILASSKIVFAKIENETQLAALLNKDVNYYLVHYKEVASMRNAYNEVYKIAQDLQSVASDDRLSGIEKGNKQVEKDRVANENDAIVKTQNQIKALEDRYHYKQDILSVDFMKINNQAAVMLQNKGVKSGDVTYYNAAIKADQPFPIGPYAVWINQEDRVVYYSAIIAADKKDYKAINEAFDKLETEIKTNISPDLLAFGNNGKKITILKPLTDFVIETELLSVQKWQAVSITFKHKTE